LKERIPLFPLQMSHADDALGSYRQDEKKKKRKNDLNQDRRD
jgi:hypothetical protein